MSKKDEAILAIFRITSRDSGHEQFAVATTAQDACSSLDVSLVDSHVVALNPTNHRRPDGVLAPMIKLPCRVCPYQYAACLKPSADPCPARGSSPELKKWLKQTTKAHNCDHVGVPIFKKDFEEGQMWLTEEEATYLIACQAH